MAFEHVLKGMVDSVDGGLAAVIIGRDGIAVENYTKQGGFYDMESIAAFYSKMIADIKKTSEVLSSGSDIDEITISAKKFIVFIRLINEDYFMVLIVKSDVISGKARFVLKNTALKIANEF